MHVQAMVIVWKSENTLWESTLSLRHVASEDPGQLLFLITTGNTLCVFVLGSIEWDVRRAHQPQSVSGGV